MTFTDPGENLQRAIVAALKGDDTIRAIVGDRVYDRVPRGSDGLPSVPFPYVTLGETQTFPELGELTDAAETYVTLHTWSRGVGAIAVKALNKAVVAVLHDAELALTSGRLQSLLLNDSRVLNDPDGLTSHGVLAFHILTDAN